MRYHALCCDYDGTVASEGVLDASTAAALRALRASGRKLLLVTGRQLEDLRRVCSDLTLFDAVIVENGALMFDPASQALHALAEAIPQAFVAALRARGVDPLGVGRVIVATCHPHEAVVLDVIRTLGLELNVIFNKGAVMVLPSGVNKATGLEAGLAELGISPHNAVGVGDAENDHALLARCECGVAVANAIEPLKARADLVTTRPAGAGVAELCERILATDLQELEPVLSRHDIPIGHDADGRPVDLPYGRTVLVAGTSGGGKSTAVTGLLERMAERQYQHCILDPEGDYASYHHAVVLGDVRGTPTADEVLDVLADPQDNVAANLLGLSLEQRPQFLEELLPRLQAMRAHFGRPHWIVLDEAHHLLPARWEAATLTTPQELRGTMLITVHPEQVAPAILRAVDLVLAVGKTPTETLAAFARVVGLPTDALPAFGPLEPGHAVAWWRRSTEGPVRIRTLPPRAERKRHVRKYAEGELGPDKSFYFRGRDGRLNLRAQNLRLFLQVADGVDGDTWMFHLGQRDYSRWVRDAIKDDALADEIAAIEEAAGRALDTGPGAAPPRDLAGDTRARVRVSVEARYTAPAEGLPGMLRHEPRHR